MKLAIWSPLPPKVSPIAEFVAATLPPLSRRAEIEVVCENPDAVGPRSDERVRVCAPGQETAPDLDLYHLDNGAECDYIQRACLARPGVALLHTWNLHEALLRQTVDAGRPEPYRREMRRVHRETGTRVARQIARTQRGAILPALFPLNRTVLEASLGIVTLSRAAAAQARQVLPDRPVLHLPRPFAPVTAPLPSRAEARRALGIPEEARVITTVAPRGEVAERVVTRLARRWTGLRLIDRGLDWRHDSLDAQRHMIAADVILALRFPCLGEIPVAAVAAMGLGRPILVTAGTALHEEMPAGTVVPIDPGPYEEVELEALLQRLLSDPALGERIGRLARQHVDDVHNLAETTRQLIDFLHYVHERKDALTAAVEAGRAEPDTRLGYFKEEIRGAARDLGLADLSLGLDELLAELASGRRGAEVNQA